MADLLEDLVVLDPRHLLSARDTIADPDIHAPQPSADLCRHLDCGGSDEAADDHQFFGHVVAAHRGRFNQHGRPAEATPTAEPTRPATGGTRARTGTVGRGRSWGKRLIDEDTGCTGGHENDGKNVLWHLYVSVS